MTLRSIFESVSKSLRFRKEIERSYPPEWAQVVGEYRDLGVELNTLKLRGIVQYLGVDKPKTRWRIDPEAPARWPVRTTDLSELLRKNPEDGVAKWLLMNRGYQLERGVSVEIPDGERGRPRHLRRKIIGELSLYLRTEYEKVETWNQKPAIPQRLVKQIHKLLVPYFSDLAEHTVRNTLEDLNRPA